jgi:putative transposase
MPVMAVNNENQHEQTGGYRSRPRWSAGKKTDAVLRLLRGEPLETLSRELGVEAHRLAAWRDEFLEGGKEALKGQRPDRSGDDRALKQAERKIGQLTMENDILRAAAEKGGCRSRRRSGPDSHGPHAAGGGGVPRARCAALHGLRSSRTCARVCPAGPGHLDQRPRPARVDPPGADRLAVCRGGYRKVRARLRREHGVQVSGKRVLRLLRREGLLAPQRVRGRRKPRPHDGTIIPEAPNQRWGTDATMAWTRSDGWVWVFACIDHYTAEAWAHVAKVGDRFAALQPVYDAVTDRWGQLGPDVARGLELRHDWGPQYRSAHFTGSLAWLGITDSPAFLGEPETNGCAERWIRTLKDQCLWAQLHDTIDELRQAVAGFIDRYNSSWLIQRHGHRTPREAYQAAQSAPAA